MPETPTHDVYFSISVVGVSALTAPRSPLLAGQHFDVVIVDEAGQISQPAVLGGESNECCRETMYVKTCGLNLIHFALLAIMAADSFVLVGDHMQLPPLVKSEVAEEAGELIEE